MPMYTFSSKKFGHAASATIILEIKRVSLQEKGALLLPCAVMSLGVSSREYSELLWESRSLDWKIGGMWGNLMLVAFKQPNLPTPEEHRI